MKKYFAEYEKYISREFKHRELEQNTTIRKCFRIQAEKLAGFIKNADIYTPFALDPLKCSVADLGKRTQINNYVLHSIT